MITTLFVCMTIAKLLLLLTLARSLHMVAADAARHRFLQQLHMMLRKEPR